MTKQRMLLTILTLTLGLAAAPAFAQRGGGVGIGNRTNVGVGNTRVEVPPAKVGARTDADADTRGSVEARTRDPHAQVTAREKTDLATRIDANPKLAAKIQTMLPSGESISQAAAGFKNEGQFLAALHVSHELNIPFDQLKAKLTGPKAMSLGAAIKASRPEMSDAKAKEEAKKAEQEARQNEKTFQ